MNNLLVSQFLIKYNCPTNVKGFYYLRDGIRKIMHCINCRDIHKILYLDLAKEHKTNNHSVERCIRTIINSWWGNGLEYLFVEKPKPKEFLTTLAELITYQNTLTTENKAHVSLDSELSTYDILFG